MANKPVAKNAAKKPATKAASSKDKNMAKKSPVKKAAPKKIEKKTSKPSLLKTASKFVAKVAKGLSKEQMKKLKEKEIKESKAAAAKEKALAAKEKAQALKEKAKQKALEAKEKANSGKDKSKQKELEKKQKEALKAKEKADKEALKARAKAEKESAKKKKKGGDDFESGGEEEGMEARKPREDEDFDEFEEDYKKSKATKKTGKKAYETDEVHVDVFETKQSKKYNNQILADIEGKIADEIAELREHFNWKDITEAIGTMDFFIDAKNDECIEKGCDNIRTTQSYCRLHYLRNWKVIQKKRDILKEGKLQEYIEELISKYPVKYIEALLSDLSDGKEFYKVLNELNITSEFDFEEDDFENAADDDADDDDIAIETISSSLRYEDE
jgi:hypothetical protein